MSMLMASAEVMGARWKVTSFMTSTKIPPSPNISIGPELGVAGHAQDHLPALGHHALQVDALEEGVRASAGRCGAS